MKYAAGKLSAQTIPRYPAITRDLALSVAKDIPAADIERVIKKNAGSHFRDICLFDVYTGRQVAEGEKSMAFSLQFQSDDRTLTDEEIDAAMAAVVDAVSREFAAQLRV